MAIEDTLNSIDNSLKLIVTILQSAGTITAEAVVGGATQASGATETVATGKKPAAKKKDTPTPVVEGDPEGTLYFVSEELLTVYAQIPGNPAPQPASFKPATAAEYSAKKEEFAKKSAATGAQSTAAAATPAVSTPAASTASSDTPTWKDCLTAIQALNKSTEPGHGRDGVMAVLKQFGLEGQKVPALEALNKHAEVLKFTNDLLNGAAEDDQDLGI